MRYSILNAFVDSPLSGNPAAVCYLEEWLSDELMTKIAQQFGYSETAFVIQEDTKNLLRWFTPYVEVDLCGHATMAAAHHIFAASPDQDALAFETRSGSLSVRREDGRVAMNFPGREVSAYDGNTDDLVLCLDTPILETAVAGPTILAVVRDEETVRRISPDLERIAALPFNALIPTAEGSEVDFVSRFFGPRIGIAEDPVTGAAHTGLAPFWSQRLAKTALKAKQLSSRGGSINCAVSDDRVILSGQTEMFATGEFHLNT